MDVLQKNLSLTLLPEEPHQVIEAGLFKAKLWSPLPDSIIERISGLSWTPDCPVPMKDLSYIQVSHWTEKGEIHSGELIYNNKLAKELIEIFQELFEQGFPIERMQLIDNFEARDENSMAVNNSSAFCSRPVTGKPGIFSIHSYGCAIDINPVVNPYLKGECLLPRGSDPFLNRELNIPGMILKGGACHEAFHKRGYIWGGDWDRSALDFHHFEKDPSLLGYKR